MGEKKYCEPMFCFFCLISISCALLPLVCSSITYAANTDAPAQTHKLVFVHASVGEQWLSSYLGGSNDEPELLPISLGGNNYYVSDYNLHNHAGDGFPDHNYQDWYRSLGNPYWFDVLLNHNTVESAYNRQMSDPGGENDIIMIKPCFIQYPISGSPDDPPSGCDPMNALPTVGDIKQVMLSLLSDVFSQHPDKIFVLVTAPPKKQEGMTNPQQARAVANWMVHDMLDGYNIGNVMVFDLYNVLTSNADGAGDPCGPPDNGLVNGNHHRMWNDQIQHQIQYNQQYSGYCFSHPNKDGRYKATIEFVPLLNNFINNRTVNAAPLAPRNLRIVDMPLR